MCCNGPHANMVSDDWIATDMPSTRQGGSTYVLISANDYRQTGNVLPCAVDGGNMAQLAQACGVTELQYLRGGDNTKDSVAYHIESVMNYCSPGDMVIFYYSGLGVQLGGGDDSSDASASEEHAFGFVDALGQVHEESCMSDASFAEVVAGSLPEGVELVLLTDLCKSGPVVDLSRTEWREKRAICIAGWPDPDVGEESAEIGGVLTSCLLLAVERMARMGFAGDVSCAMLYNAVLAEKARVFPWSTQHVSIEYTSRVLSGRLTSLLWPLLPAGYRSPPLGRPGLLPPPGFQPGAELDDEDFLDSLVGT